jgi:hypothetical protein
MESAEESDRMPRLHMAEEVSGKVSDYSFPEKKRDLKNRIIKPFYWKNTFSGIADKSLPVGRSILGNFSLSELRGNDLMVIEAPHATASDYEFPEQVLIHRPKQKLQRDPASVDQSIAIFSPNDYESICLGGGEEIRLPAPRHDTFWLIGNRAIEANLEEAIRESTTQAQRDRGAHSALARVAEELIENANSESFPSA